MPPKKKKSGKKGKKSGKKQTEPIGEVEKLSDGHREFYLVQIRDLEHRLDRYQKKCDELEVMNNKFISKYDQMSTDKKEIVSFLKKSLEQRGDEIADLNDRLIGLQQAKDSEKESYEQQLQTLRTEFQETKDQLTSENMILGGKLASLEEFKIQKEDLMAKFAAMEEQLAQQAEDHKNFIYSLERKQVVDKDRLKKEMVMRVNQVAAEFRKVSNKQMAETTKRTIRENVSINSQLAKMSDKTMELIQENDELKEKEKKQRLQIDMLEANEKELAKKNISNQKVIRMLTEKCKSLEDTIEDYEAKEQEHMECLEELDMLREQIQSTSEEINNCSRENDLLHMDLTGTKQELTRALKDKQKLEKVLADAADALTNELRTHTDEDAEESTYEQVEKRDMMLENLLVLLNSAAAIGVGPTPGDMAKQEEETVRSASIMPGSGKGFRKGELPQSPIGKPEGTLPHYKLGDLGLIPRPNHHIPTSYDKMKELSNTTRMSQPVKVSTRTVGVQTLSAAKAMFYADQLLSRVPQNAQLVHELQTSLERENSFPPIQSSSKKYGSIGVTGKVY